MYEKVCQVHNTPPPGTPPGMYTTLCMYDVSYSEGVVCLLPRIICWRWILTSSKRIRSTGCANYTALRVSCTRKVYATYLTGGVCVRSRTSAVRSCHTGRSGWHKRPWAHRDVKACAAKRAGAGRRDRKRSSRKSPKSPKLTRSRKPYRSSEMRCCDDDRGGLQQW